MSVTVIALRSILRVRCVVNQRGKTVEVKHQKFSRRALQNSQTRQMAELSGDRLTRRRDAAGDLAVVGYGSDSHDPGTIDVLLSKTVYFGVDPVADSTCAEFVNASGEIPGLFGEVFHQADGERIFSAERLPENIPLHACNGTRLNCLNGGGAGFVVNRSKLAEDISRSDCSKGNGLASFGIDDRSRMACHQKEHVIGAIEVVNDSFSGGARSPSATGLKRSQPPLRYAVKK